MDGRVRWIAFAVILVALALVLFLVGPQNMPGVGDATRRAQSGESHVAANCVRNPYFRKSKLLGEWQRLEAWTQGERGVAYTFNPFTMTCDEATGRRDIWLQMEHRTPVYESFEDETTIEEVRFTRERYLYRIDCRDRTFAVLERRLMGAGPDEVARAIPLADPQSVTLEPFREGGVASIIAAPACSTGSL